MGAESTTPAVGAKVVNEVTGECVITDKSGRTYSVVFDLTAVMVLEKMAGRGVMEILRETSTTDCVLMIIAGTAGWGRRNHGGPKVSGNLAQRIFLDSGGYAKLASKLIHSLSCAEGLNLDAMDDDEPEDDDAGPLGLPPS